MSQWSRASYKDRVLAKRPNATLRKTPYAEYLGIASAQRGGPAVFSIYDGDEPLAVALHTAMGARSAWALAFACLNTEKPPMTKKRPDVDPKVYDLAEWWMLSVNETDHAATNDEIWELAHVIQTACEDAARELEARQAKKETP